MLHGKLAIRAFKYKEIAMVKPHDEFEFTMKKMLKQVMWMPRLNYPAAEKRPIDVLEEKEDATPQLNKRLRMMTDEKPLKSNGKISRNAKNTSTASTIQPSRQTRHRKFIQGTNKRKSNTVNASFNPFKPLDQKFESTFGKPSAQVLSPPEPKAISLKQIVVTAHANKELKATLADSCREEVTLFSDFVKQEKRSDEKPGSDNTGLTQVKDATNAPPIVITPVTVGIGEPALVAQTGKQVSVTPFQQITSEENTAPSSNTLTLYSIQKQYIAMKKEFLEHDEAEKEKFVKLDMSKGLEEFTTLLNTQLDNKQVVSPFMKMRSHSSDDVMFIGKYQRDFEERERIKEAYRRLKNEDVTDSFVCRSESPMSLVYEDDLDSADFVDEVMEVDQYPLHYSPGVCNFFTNYHQQSPHYFTNAPMFLNLFQQHQPLQQYQEQSRPFHPTDEEMPLVVIENHAILNKNDANERRKRRCDFDSSDDENEADDEEEEEVDEVYGNASKRIRCN